MSMTRVLVLGVSGMLGHKVFQVLRERPELEVFGTSRSTAPLAGLVAGDAAEAIVSGVDAQNFDSITRAVADAQPDVVINCVGLIKQLPEAKDPLLSISVNAQLPHRIALLCRAAGARLIHVSTDCVFDGVRGGYTEDDPADATDLYGRTKYLGEVDYPHCVTLRTSIIGHELRGHWGLVDWFLRAGSEVTGYTDAWFSGLPTCELAGVIADHVIPRTDLSGLYQVGAARVSKLELLCTIRDQYGVAVTITPSDAVHVDRSLRSDRFRQQTGYEPPDWAELVRRMHADYVGTAGLYEDFGATA
jgi:dTDP-4-dehydrorhamnose reductase